MTAANPERVRRLIAALGVAELEHVFNPWRDSDPLDLSVDGALSRRRRLEAHWACPEPAFLLVGEAPGYQGCHFSGVPFTNEKLILSGAIPRVSEQHERFGRPRLTIRPNPWSEPAATIMWRVLHELGIADRVVMWNAFAWHPHKPGMPMSNRAPTKFELLANRNFLREVCDIFGSVRLVAVGRVAESALATLRTTPDACVRHPSMGGAAEFERGMRALVR